MTGAQGRCNAHVESHPIIQRAQGGMKQPEPRAERTSFALASLVLTSDYARNAYPLRLWYKLRYLRISATRERFTPILASMSDNAFKSRSQWIEQRFKMMVELYNAYIQNCRACWPRSTKDMPMSFTLDGRHRVVHTWIIHSVYTNFRSELNIRHILRPYLFSMIVHKPCLNSLPEG